MNEHIPKIIHYCWFGRGAKPDSVLSCIKNWESVCPDYEIVEWNEDNFDINTNIFVREAYENKKYAFVADYVRLYALYAKGGIYLDTDVYLLKTFDDFLQDEVFMSFESSNTVCTAVIGAKRQSKFIKELLDQYRESKFVLGNGKFNDKPNSEIIFLKLFSGKMDRDSRQQVQEVTIYPVDYFCGKDYKSFESLETTNTVAVHMLDASWYPMNKRLKRNLKKFLLKCGLSFLWK
ncbi:hypothetical protein BTJ18_03920 [Lactobacillus delbrueckii subsp. bulgaricus]|nr:hypothetical protein [Lactobacillus delbrueckii subsp. bulgaricus]